jgi:hypothetical protein
MPNVAYFYIKHFLLRVTKHKCCEDVRVGEAGQIPSFCAQDWKHTQMVVLRDN